MLQQWNAALRDLFPAVTPKDAPDVSLSPYGEGFTNADKADIPSADLPAGIPRWMYDNDGWARRVGASVREKRRNITITVPEHVIP
jgi:hypothetical protein